jgi:hypothetical protein
MMSEHVGAAERLNRIEQDLHTIAVAVGRAYPVTCA